MMSEPNDVYVDYAKMKAERDALAAQRDEGLAREELMRLGYEKFKKRLVESEKDAARYRFLRDRDRGGIEHWDEQACVSLVCRPEDAIFGEALDFTVDKAIEEMAARLSDPVCLVSLPLPPTKVFGMSLVVDGNMPEDEMHLSQNGAEAIKLNIANDPSKEPNQ